MLGNCERMEVVTPPTSTNQLPQSTHQIDDHKVSNSMASSGSRVMEKPGQELLQQQQQALNCPRCNSANTKFCYYNNYSLSQPRHFCKACKRYWTRGGTLRNVPVGGGCRKNKRVKRPTIIDTASSSSCSPSSAPQPQIDAASTSNHINPLFYGLASNPCDVNLPFISRFNSRISSSGFDLQPQLSALGLGFSSGPMSIEAGDNIGYRNGLTSDNNNTLLSSYSSIFSSSSSTCTSTTTSPPPVMMPNSSLLGSNLMMQQKLINGGGVKNGPGGNTTFQGLVAPLDQQLQIASDDHSGEGAGMVVALKDVKVELGQNRLELWNNGTITAANCQNQIEHVTSLSDPNSLYWNSTTVLGAWNDQPNNIGPSVTSLI